MFLKVDIDGIESFHEFEGLNSVTIGKSDKCNLMIENSFVSRVHGKVMFKGGEFYFIDENSRYGSFLNEERLPPGAGVIFNTFFPIRLGKNVFVSITDENTTNHYSESDTHLGEEPSHEVLSSHVKSEKYFENVKTIKPDVYVPDSAGTLTLEASKVMDRHILTERQERQIKRSSQRTNKKAKKVNRTQQLLVFLLLLIIGSFFYYKEYMEEQDRALQRRIVKNRASELKNREEIERKEKEERLRAIQLEKQRAINTLNSLKNFVKADKCLLDVEKYLCSNFFKFHDRKKYEGYSKSLETLHLVIDDTNALEKMNKIVKPLTESELIEASAIAKKEIGRGYERFFYAKNKIKRLEDVPNFLELITFSNFIKSGGMKDLKRIYEQKKLERLVFIRISKSEYKAHFNIDIKKLMKRDDNYLTFLSKAFIKTSLSKELKSIIKSLKIQ